MTSSRGASMAQQQPMIRVGQLDGLGLIIAHPSSVLYGNQTGGYACHHPAMEGAFVPWMDPDIAQQMALEEHCTGPKWYGHCYNGIDDETADVVDGILATSPLTRMLQRLS